MAICFIYLYLWGGKLRFSTGKSQEQTKHCSLIENISLDSFGLNKSLKFSELEYLLLFKIVGRGLGEHFPVKI